MNKINIMLSCLVLPFFFMAVAQADAFYPMMCRGGDKISVTSEFLFSVNSAAPGALTGGGVRLRMTFLKGTISSGANGENLEPSTCAWMDRGLATDEPSTILYQTAPGMDPLTVGVEWKTENGITTSPRISTVFDVLNSSAKIIKLYVIRVNAPFGSYFSPDPHRPVIVIK